MNDLVQKKKINYAFIDSQNLNLAIQGLGWKLDFIKFRIYLKHKFKINKAFIFISHEELLKHLGLKESDLDEYEQEIEDNLEKARPICDREATIKLVTEAAGRYVESEKSIKYDQQ